MINMRTPSKIIWVRYSDYYKVCDQQALRGGCYSLVFTEMKPESYQYPCEFEESVYFGESAGYYLDPQGSGRLKIRSHIHKRMTDHHKPLTTGKGGESNMKNIIGKYGYGEHILDGTLTGIPLWLCILVPREDLPESMVKAWVQFHERDQILSYMLTFNRSPLGNNDCDSHKDPDSWSTKTLQKMGSLESFMS